jgi:hypothetical protein
VIPLVHSSEFSGVRLGKASQEIAGIDSQGKANYVGWLFEIAKVARGCRHLVALHLHLCNTAR